MSKHESPSWWVSKKYVDKADLLIRVAALVDAGVDRIEIQDDRGGSGQYILFF